MKSQHTYRKLLWPKALLVVVLLLAPLSWVGLQHRADNLYKQAQNDEIASRPGQAAAKYLAYLMMHPTNQKAANNLARIYVVDGQAKLAAKYVNKARGKYNAGHEAQRHLEYSRALLELGKDREASEEARAAHALQSNDKTLFQLEAALTVSRDSEGLKRVIAAHGLASKVGVGETTLAQALIKEGLRESALRLLEGSSEKNAQAYLLMGSLAMDTGRLKLSRQYAAAGLNFNPADQDLHQLLQDVLSRMGDREGAQKQGERVKSLKDGRI